MDNFQFELRKYFDFLSGGAQKTWEIRLAHMLVGWDLRNVAGGCVCTGLSRLSQIFSAPFPADEKGGMGGSGRVPLLWSKKKPQRVALCQCNKSLRVNCAAQKTETESFQMPAA